MGHCAAKLDLANFLQGLASELDAQDQRAAAIQTVASSFLHQLGAAGLSGCDNERSANAEVPGDQELQYDRALAVIDGAWKDRCGVACAEWMTQVGDSPSEYSCQADRFLI